MMLNLHRPVVGGRAARYVLLMMLSFALCVVVTRVYLELTGYPQIGNETFHFAHALWGGLLQFVAALLLLIFANRWMRDLSAVLAGLGVGLFIDEVGKFITQQNDYFFPLAAPIIYVAFLLTLLIYLIVRQRQSVVDLHADIYQVLEELEEVLEDDLSISERDQLLHRLERIQAQTIRPDLAELARHITLFLQSEAVVVKPDRASRLGRLLERLTQLETRLFSRRFTRLLLAALFLFSGITAALVLFLLIEALTGDQSERLNLLRVIVMDEANVRGATSLSWYLVMMVLQVLTGILLFGSALAFFARQDRLAVSLGAIALVVELVFLNTLSFYFNQFSVLLSSLYAFSVLLILERYRSRFLAAGPDGHSAQLVQLE